MILPDVNLLIYAYDENSKFHAAAAAWLESVLSDEQVFFSWRSFLFSDTLYNNKCLLYRLSSV